MRTKIIPLIIIALVLALPIGCTNDIAEERDTDVEAVTGTGVYVGRSDNNFIEIEVDGAPSEEPFTVFMLSEELKKVFDAEEPEPGALVSFEYTVNEYGQNLLNYLEAD